MRAGDRQHMAVVQHIFRQPLRTGLVRQTAVQHGFDDLDAAAHDVADDDAVGIDVQLRRVDALVNVDAELLQLCAHRRVNVAIAAGHLVTRCAGQRCNAAHEGSANTENVYVHNASGHRARCRIDG